MKTELITWLTDENQSEDSATVLYKYAHEDSTKSRNKAIWVCEKPFEKYKTEDIENLIKNMPEHSNSEMLLPVCGEFDFLIKLDEFKSIMTNCKKNNIKVILEYNLDWSALFGYDGFRQRYTARELAERTGESTYLVYMATMYRDLYTNEFDELPLISLGIRINNQALTEDVFKYTLEMKKKVLTLDYLRVDQKLFDRDTEQDENAYFEELFLGEYKLDSIIIDGA